MPEDIEQRLCDGLAQLGVAAGPELTGRLAAYLDLLRQWSRAYNLTSVTDPHDMVVRHILDSASARPFLAGTSVLDAGSGAGLPGLVLAALEPARQFTLLDSVGKKVRFLRQAVMELKLDNVTPVQARLESWHSAASFDAVICRAFDTLAAFVTLGGRHAAPAGRLIAMKGRYPATELAALPAGWRAVEVARVSVPGLDAERHVVVLERSTHG